MATLSSKLTDYKWLFFEKGIMHVWNELKRLSNTANTAQLGAAAAFGTIDYVTNCDPDVVESVHNPQHAGYADVAPPTLTGSDPPTNSQA